MEMRRLFRLRNNISLVEPIVSADGVFAIWDRALLQEMGICSINPEILNWMPVLNTEANYSGNFRERHLLMQVISGPSGVMPTNREEFSSLTSFISK
jgi:hypothetical protein